MSNLTNTAQVLEQLIASFEAKMAGEDTTKLQFDKLSSMMRWTDAVSPTLGNIAVGKSSTGKEAYEELKGVVKNVLIAKKRGHTSPEISAEMTDLKNRLMNKQDPDTFAATKGNMGKILKVSTPTGLQAGKVTLAKKKELKPLAKVDLAFVNLWKQITNGTHKGMTKIEKAGMDARKIGLSKLITELKIKR